MTGTRPLLAMVLSVTALAASAQEGERRLEGMSVIGNEELPKSLYIIPWKEAGHVDIAGQAPQRLIDEALEPVDPEVFRRELHYRGALDEQ